MNVSILSSLDKENSEEHFHIHIDEYKSIIYDIFSINLIRWFYEEYWLGGNSFVRNQISIHTHVQGRITDDFSKLLNDKQKVFFEVSCRRHKWYKDQNKEIRNSYAYKILYVIETRLLESTWRRWAVEHILFRWQFLDR